VGDEEGSVEGRYSQDVHEIGKRAKLIRTLEKRKPKQGEVSQGRGWGLESKG